MALALLKRILRGAEERGQPVDPASSTSGSPTEEREPRFLTWDEAEELRSWMPEHVARIVPIAILTMLRRGEILGLRDRDIDFEAGSITSLRAAPGRRHASRPRRAPDGARSTSAPPRSGFSVSSSSPAPRTRTGSSSPARRAAPSTPHNFMHRVFKPAARHAGSPSSPSTTSATPAPR